MKHSQQWTKPYLQPWIGITPTGVIIAAHCTCMAGLGECCSHVAGTLFALESAIAIARNKSCTDEQQQWHSCSLPKTLQFKRGCDIDFAQPETKRRKSLTECDSSTVGQTKNTGISTLPPADYESFYAALHGAEPKTIVLSAIKEYSECFAPKTMTFNLPKPLSNLYKSNHLNLDYYEVLKVSQKILCNMNLNNSQVSQLWKNFVNSLYDC